MVFGFLTRRRRTQLRAQPFPPDWREIIERNLPIFRRLPPDDQAELLGHVQVFLAEKKFEGCGGLELTDEIRVTIAAQACLLLLHRSPIPRHLNRHEPDLGSALLAPNVDVRGLTPVCGIEECVRAAAKNGGHAA
jgi:hypothetical protein